MRPNTDDAGLDKAGVAVDLGGFITVDDHLRTNVPGIYALGDCNGRGTFTHTSYNDFKIVAANLLDADDRSLAVRVPAYALHVDLPLGRVGMTEAEARSRHGSILDGQRPMMGVGRAVEKGETQGLMKAVVDPATDQILGAAILGPGGEEPILRASRHDERRRDHRQRRPRHADPPNCFGTHPDNPGLRGSIARGSRN